METYLHKAYRGYKRHGILPIADRATDLPLLKLGLLDQYFWKKKRVGDYFVNRLNRNDLGANLTDTNITKYKSSDTVFILGSGGSISEICEQKWKYINECDSIGLNRWPIHDFIPTIHVFEPPNSDQMERKFWELLEFKRKEYRNVPIIMKNPDLNHSIDTKQIPNFLQGELLLSPDFELPPINDSKSEFESMLKYIDDSGMISSVNNFEIIFRKRLSISYLLFLSYIMGYKNIVLCGVDMVDSKYFFDINRSYYEERDVPIPEPEVKRNPEKTHSTNDPSVPNLTGQEVIHSINRNILKPNNVKLYVENKKSALHPNVSCFDMDCHL